MLRRAAPLYGLAFAAACGSQRAEHVDIAVSEVVVTEPVLGERAAMYFRVSNGGEQDEWLTAISTTVAERAEIHRTVDHGGMMAMEPVGSLVIPAGGSVRLAPGGHHVMLLKLTRTLAPGETVRATLRFQSAGDVTVQARVVAYSELEEIMGSGGRHHPGTR